MARSQILITCQARLPGASLCTWTSKSAKIMAQCSQNKGPLFLGSLEVQVVLQKVLEAQPGFLQDPLLRPNAAQTRNLHRTIEGPLKGFGVI